MSRPPEPEVVVLFRARKKEPVPRCCHTCDNYNEAGWCPDWIEEVPF